MLKSIVKHPILVQNSKFVKNVLRSITTGATQRHSTVAENVITAPHQVNIPDLTLTQYVFLEHSRWKNLPAVINGDTGSSYSFADLLDVAGKISRGILDPAGLGHQTNDTIGVILPNIPEFAAIVYGATDAGQIVTFANPLYTANEICRQFENAGVTSIFTLPELLPIAQAFQANTKDYKGTVVVGTLVDDRPNKVFSYESLVSADYSPKMTLPNIDTDNVAVLPYSSGTTGLPKGVMLTHKNLVANLHQGMHTSVNRFRIPNSPHLNSHVLSVPPFFHIYGFNGVLNYCIHMGSPLVVIPKFTPEAYIKCLVEYRPRALFLVPSLLLFLATHPSVTKDHLASIVHITVGAAPASVQVIEKFKAKAENDVFIAQGYGMTESSPVTLYSPLVSPPTKVASTGQLYPSTEARIVSLTDGTNLGAMQNGELLLRGPQVMKGYLNNEQATIETLDADGWLHTGDIAYYDSEQYFYIVDRTKELIKVKGNQVSPSELENLILELTDIVDVAVTGIADEVAGEVPKAFVVLKPNAKLTKQDILDYVKGKVVKYKQLKGGVKFLKAIPRNPSGKIMRRELDKID